MTIHPGTNRIRAVLAGLILGVLIFSSGCGQKAYEERLQRTVLLDEYLHGVQDSLAPPWNRSDLEISMRLPKPFNSPMPGPERTKNRDGEWVVGEDPRLKPALGIPLQGLVEAWEAAVDFPGGSPNTWIYLLTNHDRFLNADQSGKKPEEFLRDLENELMRIFRISIPEGETSKAGDNFRFRQFIPAQNSSHAEYTSPKDYSIIRFVPEQGRFPSDLQATLYERKVGKVQVALVVLAPRSASAGFRQRLEQSLETLEIKEVMPRKRTAAGGTGGTPGSGGSNSGDF